MTQSSLRRTHRSAVRDTNKLLAAETTGAIIGSFLDVRRALGFGFRERIYALAMERDLRAKGHRVDREVAVVVYFRGEPLARQRIDMIVDEKVIVETKAGAESHLEGQPQLFSYLAATTLEVGLLLYFGRKPQYRRFIFENRLKTISE
jgi:GxxExxY protein